MTGETETKKQLEQLQSELNKEYPQLLNIEHNKIINKESLFLYDYNLLFIDKDRGCKISLYGIQNSPKYIFEWDECTIFEIINPNIKRVGEIIINWVYKKAMPSTMQTQFPEIEFSELAKYYENGESIKGEFIESWNSIEEFYSNYFSDEWKTREDDALRLIHEMRNKRLDEKLRTGQSLWFFILSRARRHGLKENAPYLQINFLGHNRMIIESCFNDEKNTLESEVKYEGVLEELIKKLLKERIE